MQNKKAKTLCASLSALLPLTLLSACDSRSIPGRAASETEAIFEAETETEAIQEMTEEPVIIYEPAPGLHTREHETVLTYFRDIFGDDYSFARVLSSEEIIQAAGIVTQENAIEETEAADDPDTASSLSKTDTTVSESETADNTVSETSESETTGGTVIETSESETTDDTAVETSESESTNDTAMETSESESANDTDVKTSENETTNDTDVKTPANETASDLPETDPQVSESNSADSAQVLKRIVQTSVKNFLRENAAETGAETVPANETDTNAVLENETGTESIMETETDMESIMEAETDTESIMEGETDTEALFVDETEADAAPVLLPVDVQPGPLRDLTSMYRVDSLRMPKLRKSMSLLQRRLSDMTADYEGIWSVGVMDLTSGETIIVNDRSMKSASVMKLFVMAAVYDAIEHGDLERTSETISRIGSMISASSNEDANRLLLLLGNGSCRSGIAKVNEYIVSHGYSDLTRQYNGFNNADYIVHPDHFNSISAADVMKLLESIYHRTFGSWKVCNEIENLMLNQQTRYKIPAGVNSVASDVKIGNKTGEMDTVENDTAVVYSPAGDYIICVFSDEWTSKDAAQREIQALSAETYRYFNDANWLSSIAHIPPTLMKGNQ